MVRQIRKRAFDIGDKRRAAGACQKALFRKLGGFVIRDHVRTERGFNNAVKAKLFESCDHLSCFGVTELTGDGRRHYGVYTVFCIVFGIAHHGQRVQHKRFVDDRAEWALIDACAAGNTLVIINLCGIIAVHTDRFDFTCILAWTRILHNCGVWTRRCTAAAFDAFFLINMRFSIMHGNRARRAGMLAAVRNAAAARRTNVIAVNRTFIASDADHLDCIRIFMVATHRHAHALCNNSAFLVDAATHRRFGSGRNRKRDITVRAFKRTFVKMLDNSLDYLVF